MQLVGVVGVQVCHGTEGEKRGDERESERGGELIVKSRIFVEGGKWTEQGGLEGFLDASSQR